MYLSLNLSKNECPDEYFFSIAFANVKTAGTTLRKPIESIVFPIRNAYYILRRGRSNRYRTTDRYRNEDIVQIILTINRQDISFATALALTIILLSLKTHARNSLAHTLRREKKTNTGWENWKTSRCIFHRDTACSQIANPPQIQKSIFLAVGFMFRCGLDHADVIAFTRTWQIRSHCALKEVTA